MEKYILNEQTERQRSRREIRKIEQDLRNKVGRNRRRMDGAWIETPSIRAMRRRERTPARENSECEIRIQIESHRGRSETGGVGSRQASGLGDEGWRRACDSKKGKKKRRAEEVGAEHRCWTCSSFSISFRLGFLGLNQSWEP